MKNIITLIDGKARQNREIKKHLPKYYNTYYEPFVGSGSALFSIIPQRAVINDINPEITNLYECVKNQTDVVIQMLKYMDENTPATVEGFNDVKERYNNKIKRDTHDIMSAVMFIWLNHNCVVYRTNKKGLCTASFKKPVATTKKKVDAQEKKAKVYANIWEVGKYLNDFDISILNQDFEKTCLYALKDDFVYLDSPDSVTADFTKEDHERLARLVDTLTDREVFVMLSNTDSPFIRELYDGYNIKSFHYPNNNILITNYEDTNEN